MRAYAPIAVAIVAVAAPESGQAAKPSKKAKAKAKRSKKKAKKLGKKGRKLLKKGKWDKAATAFRKAMKLNPESPKYPRGLGKALESAGKLTDALTIYGLCAASEAACARGEGRTRRALGEDHGEVLVETSPEGARIRLELGGETVEGISPLRRWVRKGSWRMHVTRPGAVAHRADLAVPAGRLTRQRVKLREPPADRWSPALLTPQPEPDPAAAKTHGAEAKQAYGEARWADAAAAFERAYVADPKPLYLFNLSRCHERNGDLPKAVGYVERYADEEPDAGKRATGRQALAQYRERLAKEGAYVVVNALPPGAAVLLEGGARSRSGTAPLSRWLEAGEWELSVTAEGRTPHKAALQVKAGETLKLDVRLKESDDAAPKNE